MSTHPRLLGAQPRARGINDQEPNWHGRGHTPFGTFLRHNGEHPGRAYLRRWLPVLVQIAPGLTARNSWCDGLGGGGGGGGGVACDGGGERRAALLLAERRHSGRGRHQLDSVAYRGLVERGAPYETASDITCMYVRIMRHPSIPSPPQYTHTGTLRVERTILFRLETFSTRFAHGCSGTKGTSWFWDRPYTAIGLLYSAMTPFFFAFSMLSLYLICTRVRQHH